MNVVIADLFAGSTAGGSLHVPSIFLLLESAGRSRTLSFLEVPYGE